MNAPFKRYPAPKILDLPDAERLHLEAIMREKDDARKRYLLDIFWKKGREQIKPMRVADARTGTPHKRKAK